MRSLIALSVGALISLAAATSHGELGYNDNAWCGIQPDGTGACIGTFAGFRKADGLAELVYSPTWAPTGEFYANLGRWFSCVFPADGSLDDMLRLVLLAPDQYFYVMWNADGICTQIDIRRGSPYRQ